MAQQLKLAKKIVAIVKPELTPLMKMLGAQEVLEADETNVTELFRNVMGLDDVGIVLTQKSLIERVPSTILEDIQTKLYPVVVTLPDSVEEVKRNPIDVYRDVIRKFIGFELYIKI